MYSSGIQTSFLGFAVTSTDAEIMDAWITLWVRVSAEQYFARALSGKNPARADGEYEKN